MRNLKMLNSTKYLYKLTFIKCSYEPMPAPFPAACFDRIVEAQRAVLR